MSQATGNDMDKDRSSDLLMDSCRKKRIGREISKKKRTPGAGAEVREPSRTYCLRMFVFMAAVADGLGPKRRSLSLQGR